MKTTKLVILFVLSSTVASAFTNLAIKRLEQYVCTDDTVWCLGFMSRVEQHTPNFTGGPQALEGYTYLNHNQGRVRLAFGTLGNIEVHGAGTTSDARALQGGVVVSGPGRVSFGTSLYLVGCVKHGDYTGTLNVGRCDYVTFGNGWSIRPDGPALVLCDPQNRCRQL